MINAPPDGLIKRICSPPHNHSATGPSFNINDLVYTFYPFYYLVAYFDTLADDLAKSIRLRLN